MEVPEPRIPPGRMDYDVIRKRRDALLAPLFKRFDKPPRKYELKTLASESLLEHDGVFRMFFDMVKHEFIVPEGLDLEERMYHCIGYTYDEFNIRALNNDHREPCAIVYEKDIEHFVRYNDLVYHLLPDSDIRIQPFRDTYTCRFRINVPGMSSPLRIHRETELISADSYTGQLVQMDTWRIVHHEHGMNYVSMDFGTEAHGLVLAKFYELNFKELFNAPMSSFLDQHEIALLKDLSRKLSNKQIADRLGVDDGVIYARTNRMLGKMEKLVSRYSSKDLGNRDRLVETCSRCGLLPVPQAILDKD